MTTDQETLAKQFYRTLQAHGHTFFTSDLFHRYGFAEGLPHPNAVGGFFMALRRRRWITQLVMNGAPMYVRSVRPSSHGRRIMVFEWTTAGRKALKEMLRDDE